jgi:hypothetical protein
MTTLIKTIPGFRLDTEYEPNPAEGTWPKPEAEETEDGDLLGGILGDDDADDDGDDDSTGGFQFPNPKEEGDE